MELALGHPPRQEYETGSPYKLWYGKEAPLKDLSSLNPCFYARARCWKKILPHGVQDIFLRLRDNYPRVSSQVLGSSAIITTWNVSRRDLPTLMIGQ